MRYRGFETGRTPVRIAQKLAPGLLRTDPRAWTAATCSRPLASYHANEEQSSSGSARRARPAVARCEGDNAMGS